MFRGIGADHFGRANLILEILVKIPLSFSFLIAVALMALVGCEKADDFADSIKEHADATPAIASCDDLKGATATDDAGRIEATDDAILDGSMLVKACDPTSPNGDRAWLVSGLKAGSKDNNQKGLLVDNRGNVLTVESLAGLISKKEVKVPGTYFTAACKDLTGDGTGCDKVAEEAATETITFVVPKGTTMKVDDGKKAVKKTVKKVKPPTDTTPADPVIDPHPTDEKTAKK
ncbi:MAG: hypothetical protein WCT28_03905 [Patescibacteria group bacterium]